MYLYSGLFCASDLLKPPQIKNSQMLDVYLNASEKVLSGISNVRGKGEIHFFFNVGLLLIIF